MHREIFIPLFIVFIFLLDLYVFLFLKAWFNKLGPGKRKIATAIYWSFTFILFAVFAAASLIADDYPKRGIRNLLFMWIMMHLFSKLFAVIFAIFDDILRIAKWIGHQMSRIFHKEKSRLPGKPIPRSEFLAKSAIVAATMPAITMGIGVLSGAHNYRIWKKTIYLPTLPSAFDGIRIGQLSDIHSGSFFSKRGVKHGIEMFLAEKPDVIFFTGDLVNNDAGEVNEYSGIFDKIKAPLGVYSILGNHDYGDYRNWASIEDKRRNLDRLKNIERELGWDLLLNENRELTVDREKIAIIGVENWGKGGFQKYGDLDKAYKGCEDKPVKLLLSHDPSHWDAKVRPSYPDIDITFSGHTHGFQFGVELGNIKWSPSKYIYEQWAGLYEKDGKYIYVNRGFGFIGYPGRIGIWPEITIIELKKTTKAQKL